MTGSNSFWFGSSEFYGHEINSSMRFSNAHSPSLQRTPSGDGNRRTFTFSAWVKRSTLITTTSETDDIVTWQNDSENSDWDKLSFLPSNYGGENKLEFILDGATDAQLITNATYRDTSAWYHIVVAVDTTQGTDTNRIKLYVNGEQPSLGTATYPSQNFDCWVNKSGRKTAIGSNIYASPNKYFDGYIAEVHFIDGTALTSSSFGETKQGIWIPKSYTGSYGTNGYYLKFNQTGSGTPSSSTMGADSSGNDNHFTQSNINPIDSNIPDSPTNNFCIMNINSVIYAPDDAALTMGGLFNNLDPYHSSGGGLTRETTMPMKSGKWYCEVLDVSGNVDAMGVGVIPVLAQRGDPNAWVDSSYSLFYYASNGNKYYGATSSSYGSSYTQNDKIGMALDLDNHTINFYKNNAAQGSLDITDGNSALETLDWIFFGLNGGSTGNMGQMWNFGQDSSFNNAVTKQSNSDENGYGDFFYTPPSGYLALCTANFSEPTISPAEGVKPSDHFNTVLYSGDGNSTNDITGVGFKPSWTWIKERTADGASHVAGHALADEVRGYDNFLSSNDNMAESTGVLGDNDTRSSDGFQTTNSGVTNQSGQPYVSWNWLGANGTTSNSDGDISSTVSANTTAGFSIVTWTHSGGDGQTIGHGLGATPSSIIVKNRSTSGAWVIGQSIGSSFNWTNDYYQFDTAAKRTDGGGTVFGASPTSSLFTFGTASGGNGDNHLAYCFAEVEGYSKFGSYTGNGAADGAFVYTGFRPAWVMFKRTDSTASWFIADNKRDVNNVLSRYLFADLSDAENTAGDRADFLSNGFKARVSNTNQNASGGTYIYMAFAEMPFKYANAR